MRQRSPRNDPTLLDGDSAHGNLGDPAGDERAVDSDTDTGSLAGANELRQEETETFDEFERGEDPPKGGSEAGDRQQASGQSTGGEPPIRGYQRLTVPEVVRRATKLDPSRLAEVLEFERTHRNRRTLVARLSRLADRR
jgi:hypothetical protein